MLILVKIPFAGISTFAHLKSVKCLIEPDERYDIAIIGAPFDTATSYRPGTEFRHFTPLLLSLVNSLGFHCRCPFRPSCNPRRQRPPDSCWVVQRASSYKPLYVLGYYHRLW